MLVSVIHQHESVINIHMSPPLEPFSHLPSNLTPLGSHRAPVLSSLCHITFSHHLSILHMVMYVSMLISIHPSISYPHYVLKSVLCLYLLCYPTNRFFSTIFLDSVHVCVPRQVQIFLTPWIVVCQSPLSVVFFRQEYLKGLPFPSPHYVYMC